MTIDKITQILEEWAPLDYAEDFDNVGLLVGDKNDEGKGILITHDCLAEVVDEAIEKKCNLIVCFHPIIFNMEPWGALVGAQGPSWPHFLLGFHIKIENFIYDFI